jgi:CubicO group peptidase (beta-lactamase class C family)
MIVRISFLSTLFVLICACGTSQGPRFQDALNTPSFTYNKLSDTERDRLSAEIKLKYDKLLGNRGFSGQILVAKNGEIIFEDYKGYSNLSQKSPIIPETPIHLASVSKTFTGMVAMKLWEQEKLDLKAPITKYLPNFPYTEVTIEQLLSHRSGLPDYTYFMESRKYVSVKVKTKRGRWVKKLKLIQNEKPFREGNYTNQDVLDYMVQKRPAIAANPDRVFRYCNTNYVLLALIIEKVTGKDFPTYMDETVFKPLKMTNSYIFSAKTLDKYTPSYNAKMQPYRIEKYDCIYGDKNVYSTVRDLYLWDKALTEGVFLRPETLELAYQPQSPTNKYYHNYGFGWRILVKPNEEKLIYHNGWWHGNNTVFNRMIGETATIIILGNKFNKTIYKGKELGSVFTGKLDTTSLVE